MKKLIICLALISLLVQSGCDSSGPRAPSVSGENEAGELPSEPAKTEGAPSSSPGFAPN